MINDKISIIPGRFSGKRAIVTGASKGIGKATAIRLAAEGAKVGLVARGRAALEEVSGIITDSGGECLILCADCSVEEQIENAINKAALKWGGLDIIISNAAVELPDDDNRIDKLDIAAWKKIIEINLTGQFLTCKHGAKYLLSVGGGSIVCLGSNCGYLGMATNEPAYSASKGGVFAMMRVMANDYARLNIRVNMVIPGFINTPMNDFVLKDEKLLEYWSNQIPIGRAGTAQECASAILWLASEEASYCTGAALVVDGGQSSV